jgi:hypothetical protein
MNANPKVSVLTTFSLVMLGLLPGCHARTSAAEASKAADSVTGSDAGASEDDAGDAGDGAGDSADDAGDSGGDGGITDDELLNGVLMNAGVPFGSGTSNGVTREALFVLALSTDGSTVTGGSVVSAIDYDGTSSTTYGPIDSGDLAQVESILAANGAVTTTMATPNAQTTVTLSADIACSGFGGASACLVTVTPGFALDPVASGDDAGDGDAGAGDAGDAGTPDDEFIGALLAAADVPSPPSALILLATNDDATSVFGGAVVELVGNGTANPPEPVASSNTYGAIPTSDVPRVLSILQNNGATTTTTSTPGGASETTLSLAASCSGTGPATSCFYGLAITP